MVNINEAQILQHKSKNSEVPEQQRMAFITWLENVHIACNSILISILRGDSAEHKNKVYMLYCIY